MKDYTEGFTPAELELLRQQNGKYTIHDNYISFDLDIPDELSQKLTVASIEFYTDEWEATTDHYDMVFKPKDTWHKFLNLFGLTDEKEDGQKGIRLVFDEDTAQLQITHKNYSGALLPLKNKYAYIVDIDKQLQFVWDENGDYKIQTVDDQTAYEELLNKKAIPAKCADTDLLGTLAAAVESAYRSNSGYIITVYLPNFARALGVRIEADEDKDAATNNRFDFWDKIKQLENIGGVLVEKKKIQRVFTLLEYNQSENTLTFASPYLYSLMDILKSNPSKVSTQRKNNKPLFLIEGKSYLISSKIITARNKGTSQIVHYVIRRVLDHGIKTDAARTPQKQHKDKRLVSVTITYKEIIKNTPLLRETLQEAEPRRRNQILKRAVFGENYNFNSKKSQTTLLEEYLHNYTDAYNYWKDLTITAEPVTMKGLDRKITITHRGLNGDFKDKYHIPQPETIDDIFNES